jgi:hypothetical protein
LTFIIEDEERFYDRIVDQPFQSPEDSTEALSNKASKQSWARLIQKVYEVDPLVCPKRSHKMTRTDKKGKEFSRYPLNLGEFEEKV